MQHSSILICVDKTSTRLNYIIEIIFKQILGLNPLVTTSKDELKNNEKAKVYYGTENTFGNHLYIKAAKLLFETSLSTRPSYKTINNIPFLYPNELELIPADILAGSFYLLSRMEEYADQEKDEHARYKSSNSILAKMNALNIPLINVWVDLLASQLKIKFNGLKIKKPNFSFSPSYDIDMAWSFKNKGFSRNALGLIKDLSTGDRKNLAKRLRVLKNKEKDPFDNYNYLDKVNKGLKPIYFVLAGKHGKYDKNISVEHEQFQELIKKLELNAQIGIHPSYASNSKTAKIELEKYTLEKIIQKPIVKSRQHFLKLELPDTYRALIDAGIEHDYTMGYPDQIGFRAGICIPYYWYDLHTEQVTNLKIHPFQVMDVSLRNYLKLSPSIALEKAISIIDAIKTYGGDFVFIWHNSSLKEEWEGWQIVLEGMINYCKELIKKEA